MNAADVKALVAAGIDAESVEVDGGDGRYEVRVVSEGFEGLRRVKREQQVYATLAERIASGEIHAVTIRALTPAEAGC